MTAALDGLTVAEVIASVARGIASGQRSLDASMIDYARRAAADPAWELGFVPAFYQFVETTITLKLALRWGAAAGAPRALVATPVGAAYAGAYGFALEAASTVRFDLVPVPPPVAALKENR